MSLLVQIVVFLIIAAALGFALGWLVRGSRLQVEHASPETDWRARLAQLEGERDRLQAELGAAGDAGGAAAEGATSDRAKLAARVTELQGELALARATNAEHRAEVGRLEARLAELEASTAKAGAAGPVAEAVVPEGTGTPPASLSGPEGEPDDLQQISGIGPGIERTLHQLGIFHFRQIAAFTPAEVAWVNQRLRFKGRIEREDWLGQARRLAAGDHPLQ